MINAKKLTELINNFKDKTNIFFLKNIFKLKLFEAISPNLINQGKRNFRIDNMCIKHEYAFEILCHDELLRNCGIDLKILRFFDIKK